MPAECYICLNVFTRIPYLKCGHFICAECYCKCKDRKINNCSICDKKMSRDYRRKKCI